MLAEGITGSPMTILGTPITWGYGPDSRLAHEITDSFAQEGFEILYE